MANANKEIYQKGKIDNLDYGWGVPAFDLETKAVKYAEIQQIQDLIDDATVSGNSRVFWATYLITDATATAETMIPTAIFDGATLAAGNIILRNATTDKVNNGLWVVQSTGNAIRYNKADTGYGLGRSLTHIRYNGGTNAEGRWYYCITHEPNIGVDSVDFERIYLPNQGLSTTDSPTFAGVTIGNETDYVTIDETGIKRFGNAYIKNTPCSLYKQLTDVTIANTTTETSLFSGTAAQRTIPGNCLSAGDYIIIETMGKMSTDGQAETGQVKLKFNSSDLLGSSQLQLAGSKLTNDLFVNKFIIKVISAGATGSVQCMGYTMIHPGTGIVSPVMREINPAAVTVDTTADIVIDETYTWGAADTDNTITMIMVDIDVIKVS
jgi:hypothetical protein